MTDEMTPEQLKAELFGGSLRWLCSVFCVATVGLLIMAILDEEIELYFPIHLQQRGVIISSILMIVLFLSFAVVNWVNHLKRPGTTNTSNDGSSSQS